MKILAILQTGIYALIKAKTTAVWPNAEIVNIVYYLFMDLKLQDL